MLDFCFKQKLALFTAKKTRTNHLEYLRQKRRFENTLIFSIKSVFLMKFFTSIGWMQIALQTSLPVTETTSAQLLLTDEETPKKRRIQLQPIGS